MMMMQFYRRSGKSHVLFLLFYLYFPREKRLAEMKMQAARDKYGSVQPISKDEWKKEVNESSKSAWVVVYLFDHAVEACKLLDQLLLEVAKRHPDVKFVSIPSQICMENWPSR